ncbi:uncharacterized protein LOC113874924 isoform X2 [Abrus precatorius]|nr:uncharacterized protein LOC113874924 isoform X2 [Abrus precatorius]
MSKVTKNRYWVLRHGKSIPNERGLIVSSMENGTRAEFQLASDGVNQAQLAAQSFQKVPLTTSITFRYMHALSLSLHTLDCGVLCRSINGELPFKSLHFNFNFFSICITLTLFLNTGQELEANNIPLADVRIYYSPFSRTSHTAKVVANVVNLPFEGPHCKVIRDLRERYFGPSFELMSHDKYEEIWDIDEKDPLVGPEGGESVKDVASRLARAMAIMESEFEGCAILVVSHGDPLQILQTILHAANQHKEPATNDLASILEAVQVAPILSLHRKYALLTGELREVI